MNESEFTCEDCGKVTLACEKFSHWIRCECGGMALDDHVPVQGMPGYTTAGYNEGIGEYVQNKSHLNRILKEKGMREAG